MPRKQDTKQFKLYAINYRKQHPYFTQLQCARNLGIGISTLARWESQYRNNDGDIPVIGSGNYESEIQRENARLKRELSATAKRKNSIKEEILKIYNDSKQNYGAPKITKLL